MLRIIFCCATASSSRPSSFHRHISHMELILHLSVLALRGQCQTTSVFKVRGVSEVKGAYLVYLCFFPMLMIENVLTLLYSVFLIEKKQIDRLS